MKKRPGKTSTQLAGPLKLAAAAGNLAQVRQLLAEGADPDKRTTRETTPLIAAARAGHLTVVKALLEAGADPSFAHGGKRGTTALLEAVRQRQFDVASTLIKAGANVHFDWSGEGQTITYTALQLCNDLHKGSKGADLSKIESSLSVARELLLAGGRCNSFPFQSAAARGNVRLLQLILEFCPAPEKQQGLSEALRGAVLHGHQDIAVEMLRLGADPCADYDSVSSGPVLHDAVVNKLTAVVRAIIEAKTDLNGLGDAVIEIAPPILREQQDARGRVIGRILEYPPCTWARKATGLIVAVRIGALDMVELLASGGANLEATDRDGFTPLVWALKLSHGEMADTLRKAGAKEPANLDGSPQKALTTGAETGDLQKVQAAIAAGADVNILYEGEMERYTALMRAAAGGYALVVDELLKAGAKPDIAGLDSSLNAGITPLMLAARHGHAPVVKRLLEAGAQPDAQQVNLFSMAFGPKSERGQPLNAALHEAAEAGHTEVVELLKAAGANLNAKSGDSGTVLEAAAQSGDPQLLKSLVSAKGKKSCPSVKMLIAAIESRNQESVRELIRAGADVNGRTRRDDMPLASAVGDGDTEMVKLLLDAGAKPTRGSSKSPINELMLAASGGYADIVQLLIDAGANVDDQASDCATALHYAVTGAHTEVVQVLLRAGASTKKHDDEGQTPLQMAKQIVSVWSGKKKHPIVGKLKNFDAYKECVRLLEKAK